MDDSFCFRALYTICIYMRHNVMAYLTFSFFCHIIVDIILVRFQFINLLLSDSGQVLFLSQPVRSTSFSRCGISYPEKKCTAFPCWHNALKRDLRICLYSCIYSYSSHSINRRGNCGCSDFLSLRRNYITSHH